MPPTPSRLQFSTAALFSVALAVAIEAQPGGPVPDPTEETWSAVCSAKIEPPAYPDTALRSKLSGSVATKFEIDGTGLAADISVEGPEPFATSAQEAILRTVFPTPCGGRRIRVTFSFRTKPELPAQHYVSACFSHPPNQVSVIADAIKMVCSHYTYVGALVGTGGLAPITVCELLADPIAYDGKEIALLGKLADSHFDGVWLAEDNCPAQLISDGYVWPNRVWITGGSSAPIPPHGLLVLDPEALNQKLESVRKTTFLKMEEAVFITKQGAEPGMFRQNWAVIFGRIEARPQLQRPWPYPNRKWGNGFGQSNSAPVQIIRNQENEFYIPDPEHAGRLGN